MTREGIHLFLEAANKFVPDFDYDNSFSIYEFTVSLQTSSLETLLDKSQLQKFYKVTALNTFLMKYGYCLSTELFTVIWHSYLNFDNFLDVNNLISKSKCGCCLPEYFVKDASVYTINFYDWLNNYDQFVHIELAEEKDYTCYFTNLITFCSVLNYMNVSFIERYIWDVLGDYVDFYSNSSIYNHLLENSTTSNVCLYEIFKTLPCYISTHIFSKSVMCFVVSVMTKYLLNRIKEDDKNLYHLLIQYIFDYYMETYDDILSVCLYLSNNSVTNELHFISFPRFLRKIVLSTLNTICSKNCKHNYLIDTMQNVKTAKKSWIRLGEKLHPGEYRVFTLATEFFNIIRNKF